MAQNGDIVKGLYQAFAGGDVAAVLGALDPGIQWREADGVLYADRNPYVGPQAVAEGVFMRLVSDVENFRVVPGNIIDGGDTVVAEGLYTGKIKATGTPLDAQFAHVWEFRNGKVVRFQQYTDTRQWATAFGS
jgi:ketosteroid isomerase-like protein